jgi:hypothetical protein
LLFLPSPLPSSSSTTTIAVAIALFLAVAIAMRLKTMLHIAMAAWQTVMQRNAVAVRQMTTLHIEVAVQQKISWLLCCLLLRHPIVLLLCRPLAAPAGCCMASV